MKAEEQFDLIGNAAIVWFESAMDLLTASAELKRQVKASILKTGIPFSRSMFPRLMLRAFAIECLIKAHYLRPKTKKLCVGGEYIGIVKNERHDLAKLARATGISLSPSEENLLDRLSAVAIGSGRYPIFKSFDIPKKRNTSERLRIEWAEPQDEVTFRSLLERLVKPIDLAGLYTDLLQDA